MATNDCLTNYIECHRDPAVYIPIATLTVLVGGLTVAVAVYMKVHKKMLYRLVMYQVLAGIAYGAFWLLHLVGKDSSMQVTVINSLLLLAAGVKLLLGVSLTVQIYLLAVSQRNVPKLELIYVIISLLVPLALAATYGAVSYYKWSTDTLNYSNIAILGLSAVLLTAACVFLLLILLLVGRRAFCGRRISRPSYLERQHVKAVCEMLPLFAYLLIFLVHILGVLAVSLYINLSQNNVKRTEISLTVLESSWGLVASLTFAIHLAVVMWVRNFCPKGSIGRHKQHYGSIIDKVST